MHPLIPSVPLLAGCLLLLGLFVGARAWRRQAPRRRIVAWCPAWRPFLCRAGLTEPEHFLDLPGVVVSGHPDRNVARVTLGQGPETFTAYLKCEWRVSWRTRLGNFLAGFGLVSRSLREAQVLEALGREGLGAPQWLAAGEDEQGRAFLLIRAADEALDLPAALRQAGHEERVAVARRLGAALARLHDAGFAHQDLYAKHVLLVPATGAFLFLDWARARRGYAAGAAARARDLAALHATLAEALASPRERLAGLRACWRAWPGRRLAWRSFLAAIGASARRMLARRHVREKFHTEALAEPQAWARLEGEALCVTPALMRLCAGTGLEWLSLDQQPPPPAQAPASRRWLRLPGQRLALLVRRCTRRPLALLWARWRGRALTPPEQAEAALLLRLERHAVGAPRVLAMGQRAGPPGQVESFLLTEPVPDTVRLETWLARQDRTGGPESKKAVLAQAGALVHRLHDASCYFDGAEAVSVLALRLPATGPHPELVLDSVEGVSACRSQRPARARRDLTRLLCRFHAAGCSGDDLRNFMAGYQSAEASAPAVVEARPKVPSGSGGLP